MKYIEFAVPDDFDEDTETTYAALDRNEGIGHCWNQSREYWKARALGQPVKFDPYVTPITIRHQGGVLVNAAAVAHMVGDMAQIEIDTKTKYVAIGVMGTGCVALEVRPESLNVDESRRDELTFIEFDEFKDWNVICAMGGRYSATVILRKESP